MYGQHQPLVQTGQGCFEKTISNYNITEEEQKELYHQRGSDRVKDQQ